MATTNLDKAIKDIINSIDKASTGETLKDAIYNAFVNLQNSISIPAKTLSGLYPADLMTKKHLVQIFTDGLVFDAIPKKGSKKAVQSGGIADLFGDMQDIYNNYDKLFKTKDYGTKDISTEEG